MRTKKEEIFTAKNVFKSEGSDMQKIEFNKRYERYIRFCEKKI